MTTAIRPAFERRVKTRLPDEYSQNGGPSPLADFLGLFSIGLGLAELLAPRSMAALTGVREPGLLRAYGVREIASGVGILAHPRPADWLWSRVAGDAVDLATLASAHASANEDDRKRIVAATVAVLGVTVLDVLCARGHDRNQS